MALLQLLWTHPVDTCQEARWPAQKAVTCCAVQTIATDGSIDARVTGKVKNIRQRLEQRAADMRRSGAQPTGIRKARWKLATADEEWRCVRGYLDICMPGPERKHDEQAIPSIAKVTL